MSAHDTPPGRRPSSRRARQDDRSAHPTGKAIALLVAVTLLLVLLAALSTF